MKDLKDRAAELAVEILMTAELTNDSESYGDIRVNPDLLFQFYILNKTKVKEVA